MSNFVVYALPRSRTWWLSKFLNHGDWTCAHDQIRYVRSLDDVRSWLAMDHFGAVETGAASYWRIQRDMCPSARVAVIRRDPEAVIESVVNWGIPMSRDIIARNVRWLDRKLDQIERNVPGVLRIEYEDLKDEATCKRLFEFCLQEPHDHDWWAALAPLNLQINLLALVRYEIAHKEQLEKMKSVAGLEVRRLAMKRHPPKDLDGFTFQTEPLAQFMADGQHLFRDHCVLVGEPEDQWMHKNVALHELLDKAGCLQILTARSNGRMFGYLMTILSPDLEHDDPTRKVAQNTLFYASPDARGLGLKLQREAMRHLEERGGQWRVVNRAGPRGSGPRMDVLYRRLGAKHDGELWSLEIGKAA